MANSRNLFAPTNLQQGTADHGKKKKMKSINIFCWLFLFLATIFFQQVNSDDFDEYDDWEDDFAVIEDITAEEDKCANAPYTGKIGKICLVMYNMTVDHFGFHVCSKLSIKLLTKQLITFDFQCLLMDKKKITVERPSDDPNSALLNINIHKNLTVPHITVGKK
ncbi:hypothetical protein AAG570_011965 [Ranatra chinensis]|uniref:DUF4773 domain-containing protein n=1 Tax=Ranatra chinensis TaxID=642074 RepID=A0ABD0Z5R6_9HEMI